MNKIWLLALSIVSLSALAAAIQARREINLQASRPAVNDNTAAIDRIQQHLRSFDAKLAAASDSPASADEVQKQLRTLETKIAAVAARLNAMEHRPSATTGTNETSLDAMDANIETVLQSTSRNTQQIQSLTRSSQDAFNAVAVEITKLRSEITKLKEQAAIR